MSTRCVETVLPLTDAGVSGFFLCSSQLFSTSPGKQSPLYPRTRTYGTIFSVIRKQTRRRRAKVHQIRNIEQDDFTRTKSINSNFSKRRRSRLHRRSMHANHQYPTTPWSQQIRPFHRSLNPSPHHPLLRRLSMDARYDPMCHLAPRPSRTTPGRLSWKITKSHTQSHHLHHIRMESSMEDCKNRHTAPPTSHFPGSMVPALRRNRHRLRHSHSLRPHRAKDGHRTDSHPLNHSNLFRHRWSLRLATPCPPLQPPSSQHNRRLCLPHAHHSHLRSNWLSPVRQSLGRPRSPTSMGDLPSRRGPRLRHGRLVLVLPIILWPTHTARK